MRKRLLMLAAVVLLLVTVTGTALAGGAKNGTLVLFDNYAPEFVGVGAPKVDENGAVVMTWYNCEGYFLKLPNGTIHEWRNEDNGYDCVDWGMGPALGITSFHLVFKPIDKFPNDDPATNPEAWADEDQLLGCQLGHWTLNPTYEDASEEDDADLDEVFEVGRKYWSCVYLWD